MNSQTARPRPKAQSTDSLIIKFVGSLIGSIIGVEAGFWSCFYLAAAASTVMTVAARGAK